MTSSRKRPLEFKFPLTRTKSPVSVAGATLQNGHAIHRGAVGAESTINGFFWLMARLS